jgi:tetrahydromethanopterin S-methyltransferase subunit G
MSHTATPVGSSVVAVYPDHAKAERAMQQLHQSGFAMCDLSIVGRDLQTTEEPVGFVSAGDYASAGAKTGASFGGLLGLMVGAALLVVPGLGPIIVAGPLEAALLAGIEGAIAGTALGSLAGALVGWGVPKERAIKYETHVRSGKFLVVVRGNPEVVAQARTLLDPHASEHTELYEAAAS